MKNLTKIFSIILSITMMFSLLGSGCNDDRGNNNGNSSQNESYDDTIVVEDKYFFKHGRTDYVIVYPEKATPSDGTAVDELTYFLKESTGITFEAYADNQSEINGKKIISVGDTVQFQASGVRANKYDFGRSGFLLQSKGDNVYIIGDVSDTDWGTLYGAYYFLETTIGLKCYADDEIKFSKQTIIDFYDFDVLNIPQIDVRSLNYGSLESNATYRNRMKLLNRFHSSDWAINGHSTFVIMPQKKYLVDHQDWYSNEQDQLCFTNEEMKVEFIKNVKEMIENNPEAIYVCIAMEDNTHFCSCENCVAKMKTHGGAGSGGEAGVFISFVNDVAEEIERWLTEKYPARKMTLVAYAYLRSFTPPVKDNGNGKYVAAHEDVIPRDNVSVMFCPIGQDYMYGIKEDNNAVSAKAYAGWSAICNNVSIYEYATNFSYYLVNFPNFYHVDDRIEFYAQAKVSFYFVQTSWGTNTPCFDALRIFTESQLLYNPSLNYEDLVNEFMVNYYKEASSSMKKYFDLLRTHYKVLADKGEVSGTVNFTLDKGSFWPLRTLKTFNECFDEAFDSIKPLEDSDKVLYDKLWNRINREKLSTTYLLCKLYGGYFTTEEYTAMVDALEYYGGLYGFIYANEGTSANYADTINGLKK